MIRFDVKQTRGKGNKSSLENCLALDLTPLFSIKSGWCIQKKRFAGTV
jgi:hypothetical protein